MQHRYLIVGYILAVWFVISFVTNIIGPLMPLIIEGFDLSLTFAGVLPFAFFLAYGLISIPAGLMVETWGPKRALLCAFTFNIAGAFAFAAWPIYAVAVGALFVIGMGMAMLQVVINPLMRVAGGEQHFAFFSVMGQLVFGLASFASPIVFAALMKRFEAGTEGAVLAALAPPGLPWISLYWGFAAIFLLAILATLVMPLPAVELKSDERTGPVAVYLALLADNRVRLFFLGIAAYVGTEQSLANWMSQFLATYHGVSPVTDGAHAVGLFWGLMSLGCLVGLVLLKLMDARLVLRIFAALAVVCVAAALFGDRTTALIAFPASGFCLSTLFSIIFALALNTVLLNPGAFSGILCSGILGGAVAPLIVGALGEHFGLRAAMTLVFLMLGFILSISFWARPVIRNETVQLKELLATRS